MYGPNARGKKRPMFRQAFCSEDRKLPASPEICVIDDDESVRSSTEGLLRSCGFQASVFESAEAFLASNAAERCACVVSDIQMPGMSGVELVELLSKRNVAIPVVLITAYHDNKTVARANAAGAVCVLPKPFSAEALIGCIKRATGI